MTVNTIINTNTTCGRKTKYSRTSLLEPSNRKKTSSFLSKSISSEIFITIFACFFHMVVGMLRQDGVKYTCPKSYVHYHDSSF